VVDLFHFSHDPGIRRFVPHVPPTNPTPEAAGQWISHVPVDPIDVEPVGDLLELHVEAGIELRAVPSLWPLHDLAVSDRWDFSIVRMGNARPA
jgi:hypothetical protein